MSLAGITFGVVLAFVLVVPPGSGQRQDDPAKTYAGKCAACHGVSGAGNGAAAAAFNPKPPDFTSAEFQKSKTDEELAAAIKNGVGAMPAMGSQLSAEAIKALVAYVRSMGPKGS